MRVEEFDYDLPKELIAQDPLEQREMARLLTVSKETGELSHNIFKDIIER